MRSDRERLGDILEAIDSIGKYLPETQVFVRFSMERPMKFIRMFSLLSVIAFAACTKQSPRTEEKSFSALPPEAVEAAPGVGEKAPYEIKGDKVLVNNELCAVSRTPMRKTQLGQFTGEVKYDGPIEKFQGKTFVFNYCCAMCQNSFPEKWAAEKDEIMKYHGLIN